MTSTQNSALQLYRGLKYALTQVLAGMVQPDAITSTYLDQAGLATLATKPEYNPSVVIWLGAAGSKTTQGLLSGGGRSRSYPTAPGALTQVFLTDKGGYRRPVFFVIFASGPARHVLAGRVASRILAKLSGTTRIILPDDEETATPSWTPADAQATLSASLRVNAPSLQVTTDEDRMITQVQLPYTIEYSEYESQESVLIQEVDLELEIGPGVVPTGVPPL